MREAMPWKRCMKEHIRQVEPDPAKIASIRRMCGVRLRVLRQMELDEETASLAAADYYEIIKELLTALLLRHGLKSDNHECLVSFFRGHYADHEYEAAAILQLKDVRNRVTYDGVFVRKDYVERNRLEFEGIIELLDTLLDKPI